MKWKLTCRRGSYAGQSFAFDAAQVTVGRASTNSLVLDPEREPRVSAVHCTFYEENRVLLVKDSGSTNGTLVDGVKIQSAVPVYQGSLISLGEKGPEFAVECDILPPLQKTMENTQPGADKTPPPLPPAHVAPPKPPAPPPLPPGPADAAPKPFAVAPLAPQPPVAPAPAKGPAVLKFVCRSGALAGKTFEFTREAVSVGRGESNNLRLDAFQDQAASTHHCEILWKNGAYAVRDKESRNGTYINGQKIGAEAPLPSGAVLRLGEKGPEFLVTYGQAVAPEPRPAGGAPAGAKQGIGLMTLEGKLNEAKREVRREHRSRMLVFAGLLGMFLMVCGIVVAVKWDEIKARLSRQEQDITKIEGEKVDFAKVNENSQGAVYGVFFHGWNNAGKELWLFSGTAFAVNRAKGILGTNAHVAKGASDAVAKGVEVVVVKSGDPRYAYRVKQMYCHPDFKTLGDSRAFKCPDVGILEVETRTISGENLPFPSVLQPVGPRDAEGIKAGMPVCLIGYPGEFDTDYQRLADSANVAKCLVGSIGAVLKFNGGPATGTNFEEFQHTCAATPGTSGSPMLDAKGRVIALHYSGIFVELAVLSENASGQKVISGKQGLNASGLTAAVSVRYLIDLVRQKYGNDAWDYSN